MYALKKITLSKIKIFIFSNLIKALVESYVSLKSFIFKEVSGPSDNTDGDHDDDESKDEDARNSD